ncbi:MAG: response regulator transcription factor [Prevotella sp.]|nr:response regulator transcription factor [Prevotella sp.]
MKKFRILVVDDEPDIREILRFNLETEGYETDGADSAESAREMIAEREEGYYDLLLLDIMMNGISGFAFARELRNSPATETLPIIFITAKDTENDLVTGLNIGADDYIAKPFSLREVMARVKALLRRTAAETSAAEMEKLSYKELVMATDRKAVTVHGKPVGLTKTEYDILHLLLSEKHRVFSRQEIIDRAWPGNVIVLDRTVDVNMARLRKKLGSYGKNIRTRQGFGYCFEP